MNGGCSPTSKGWGTRFERVGEAGWDAFRVSALRRIRVRPTGFVFRCGPHLHVQEPGSDVASPHCGCALRSWPGFPRLHGQVLREKGPLDTRSGAPSTGRDWPGCHGSPGKVFRSSDLTLLGPGRRKSLSNTFLLFSGVLELNSLLEPVGKVTRRDGRLWLASRSSVASWQPLVKVMIRSRS